VDYPGFFFVTVEVFSPATPTLLECVSQRPHRSLICVGGAQLDGTDEIVSD